MTESEAAAQFAREGELLRRIGHLSAKLSALESRLEAAVSALKEISLGVGPYSMDQLQHASNTIEAMKEIANAAIAAYADRREK